MNVESALYRNASADNLTSWGMAFCFLVAGSILLGSLTITTRGNQKAIAIPAPAAFK